MSDRPCVEHFGPHDRHGLDCATVQEWNEASRWAQDHLHRAIHMESPGAPKAWEVEDGDGLHGIENPQTWTEVGEAILALYGADLVTQLILENHEGCVGMEEWDFSDPGQLGDWIYEDVDIETCSWHMPTDVYESNVETAWDEVRTFKGLPWHLPTPKGYTRIVWVTL